MLIGLAAPALADDFDTQRGQMVADQLVQRGIRQEQVLRAMERVPRHRFVPAHLAARAYDDGPLPIGYDQTISQPYIVALMSELLDLQPGRRVLEIGAGSGYQAAVLSQMGAHVYSIEIIPQLGEAARTLLFALGYRNIHVKIGDGYLGWPEAAPFDGIIVTCAPSQIPEPLKAQLAEGGRIVIPVGGPHVQRLVRLTKTQGRLVEEKVVDVRFVPMVNEKGEKY
ncbi:MAG: protein-L-isoaspartate(D-aspartate) O-methyltransferase [Desulfobacterales bacterium]|nr:protein-L-isoaspartate(D-aspartate) O-methyltransferase [Desulfobacterales bacterium]